MAKTQSVYNLFLRNWKNGTATEVELNLAIEKGLLTEEDKQAIMQEQQNV